MGLFFTQGRCVLIGDLMGEMKPTLRKQAEIKA
jgi:hypothetical protein